MSGGTCSQVEGTAGREREGGGRGEGGGRAAPKLHAAHCSSSTAAAFPLTALRLRRASLIRAVVVLGPRYAGHLGRTTQHRTPERVRGGGGGGGGHTRDRGGREREREGRGGKVLRWQHHESRAVLVSMSTRSAHVLCCSVASVIRLPLSPPPVTSPLTSRKPRSRRRSGARCGGIPRPLRVRARPGRSAAARIGSPIPRSRARMPSSRSRPAALAPTPCS